jgi:predicted amidophosphoribosyltransferase
LLDLIYPRECVLCNQLLIDSSLESLCLRCREQITPTEGGCLRCSAPLSRSSSFQNDFKNSCYYCENRKWSFGRAYCYTAYSDVAARASRKIKQANCESLAIEIGKMMGIWLLQRPDFDCGYYDWIVPVPQHWMRRVALRYNQAEVLAENIAKTVGIPLRKTDLFRTRWTEKQGTKTIEERLTSVDESFGCRRRRHLSGRKILLIDDIVTSGATANDAARALCNAGVGRVDVVAFSRGVGAVNNKKQHNEGKQTTLAEC